MAGTDPLLPGESETVGRRGPDRDDLPAVVREVSRMARALRELNDRSLETLRTLETMRRDIQRLKQQYHQLAVSR